MSGDVSAALFDDLVGLGVICYTNSPFIKAVRIGDGWTISHGLELKLHTRHVINAAGLYADRVAQQFGFASCYTVRQYGQFCTHFSYGLQWLFVFHRYQMLPFKGLYLYCNPLTTTLRTHVYPVPDLDTPFLGVHTTLTVDGVSKVISIED